MTIKPPEEEAQIPKLDKRPPAPMEDGVEEIHA